MLERKNIDRVFQENLKDLDINPSKNVWNGIELYLTERPVTKSVPVWQRLSGVAAIFILFFMGGVWYYNMNSISPTVPANIITETNFDNLKVDDETPLNQFDSDVLNVIANNEDSEIIKTTRDSKATVFVKKPNNNVIVTSTDISSIYRTIDSKYVVDEGDFIESLKSNKNSISNIDPVNVKEEVRESMRSKWSVGTTVAPVYYNTLQSGSPLSEDLADNTKSSDNALSVGLKLNYKINRKFNVQSGVNKVELAYVTSNVNVASASSKIASNNNLTKSGVVLSNSGNPSSIIKSVTNAQGKSNLSGELNQSMEYFEFPVEMTYNLFESKFGIGLVGGFSTYVLSKNSVYITTQDQIRDLGEANNLNNLNFSGNLGVDFDYKINKNWYLNVAPMFKYQFNTYSSSAGNFQPYYFGVYSGLNYRF
jgi:hypothetical protein